MHHLRLAFPVARIGRELVILRGELELGVGGGRVDRLHAALAVGALADDHRRTMGLQATGDDLAGAGGAVIGEDDRGDPGEHGAMATGPLLGE